MLKNTFYQAKKNFFKYIALPSLAIMASCSLSKEFVEDDLYYSPKDSKPKTEVAYVDSLKDKVPIDTLEIKTIQDLNYVVRNGANASLYWENYFDYSPFPSSLGDDPDNDGIPNIFDPQDYIPNWNLDLDGDGIPEYLELNLSTNLDFIYWDLYWNNYWNYHYNYYWNSPWTYTSNYYFNYDKKLKEPFHRRQRTLATKIYNQSNSGSKRSDELNEVRQRTEERSSNQVSTRQRYEKPKTQERINTNYNPKNIRETRNTYVPRTNTRSNTQTRTTTRQTTTTRSSSSTVRSSSGNSNSSGSSNSSSSSSSSRNSNSSTSKRNGRR